MSPDEHTLEEPLISAESSVEQENERLSTLNASSSLDANNGCEPVSTPQDEENLVDGMPWSTALLIKSLYFLEALGAAAWGRFGAIYYNLHGLNRQQIGLLEGLMPGVRTLSKPLWGVLSDQFHCRKIIYVLSKIISTSVLLLLALPFIYTSYVRILFVSLTVMAFSAGGILDAYTLDLLGTANKLRYGRYRLWASVSWGIGAIVMGYITDRYGFAPNFYIYGSLGFFSTLLVAWRIPNVIDEKLSEQPLYQQQPQQDGSVKELLQLIFVPRVSFFLIEVVIVGIGMGTVERLLFLYLVDDLQASTLLCGFSVGVNVLFELPIFWYAQVLTKLLGHDGMMIISMTCFCIRVFGYTLLTPSTRWLILFLEVMHGITFACFYVTATDIAKGLISKCPGWNTTIPVGVQTLYDALGAGIGSIGGGWVMQHYGSRFMYRNMAYIMGITLIVHVVGTLTSRRVTGKGLLPSCSEDDGTLENEESLDNEATPSIEDEDEAPDSERVP